MDFDPYATDADGAAIYFTKFVVDGYNGTIANLLFRQTSVIDGTGNIIGTTSASTMYKVSHAIAAGVSAYGDAGETTIEINGSDVKFKKYSVEDVENNIPAGAIIRTFRATPHNSRLTPCTPIYLHLFRQSAQKCS